MIISDDASYIVPLGATSELPPLADSQALQDSPITAVRPMDTPLTTGVHS
jgi:hypothetical protein